MKAIGVFSVKGGVGKTLIALNIAERLAKRAKVGFLDSDWDNSNFGQFTKLEAKVDVTKDNKFVLPTWNGIKVFSPSLMFGRDRGVSMTADRYIQMISDIMEYGDWGDLDYIVIDLPGGSSDIWRGVLEIFGQVLLGDVIVTQPQMVDALVKGLKLHKYFDIPVIGVVENMSYIACPHGEKIYLFGNSETKNIVESFGYEYLGEIPFITDVAKNVASGVVYFESETLDRVVEKVVNMELPKSSFLQRFKESFLTKIKEEVEKILVNLIVKLQREVDLSNVAAESGFVEQRPFVLTITSEDGKVILTRVPMKLKNGKLYIISKPEKIDFEIVASFKTLARCILRRAKVDNMVVDYNPMDAWAAGDIKVYGTGFTPRVMKVFRTLFEREGLMNELISKYGKVLEAWI